MTLIRAMFLLLAVTLPASWTIAHAEGDDMGKSEGKKKSKKKKKGGEEGGGEGKPEAK